MSIFSICLDLWVRYNSQFCRYEPLVQNWIGNYGKSKHLDCAEEKVSRCTICFRARKMLCQEWWVGFQLEFQAPAHVFTVNASFIRSRRKMNLILWVGGCNRSELDMCFVQLGRELYCRPALDFHSWHIQAVLLVNGVKIKIIGTRRRTMMILGIWST